MYRKVRHPAKKILKILDVGSTLVFHTPSQGEMDDGIQLNIAPRQGGEAAYTRRQAVAKGGRWGDR